MNSDAYILGETLVSIVGRNVTEVAVTDTSTSIYQYMKGTLFQENIILKNLIEELDLENKIEMIKLICNKIKSKNELIDAALTSVYTSMEDISIELCSLHQEFAIHKTKYFNRWRAPSISKNIKKLRLLNERLEKRLNLLFNIIQTYDNNF